MEQSLSGGVAKRWEVKVHSVHMGALSALERIPGSVAQEREARLQQRARGKGDRSRVSRDPSGQTRPFQPEE